MSNSTLKALFRQLQKEMISTAEFGLAMNHPVDIGNNSEENWIKWFSDYLPKRYKAAKATVIDSQGNISDQIDIVLYDSQYSYLAFNDNNILYIPAESVYAVFEVKPNLNKKQIEYASKKAESVRKLYRTSAPIPFAAGKYPPKPVPRIIAGILTNDISWTNNLKKHLEDNLEKLDDYGQLDFGCVLKGESFSFDYENYIIDLSSSEDSLIFFFLKLLIALQKMGTVPAIDLEEYLKALSEDC